MTTKLDPIRVLFVCLGNICRSPMAEAVFRALVRDAGVAHRFEIDSAGTSDYHEGEPPDARAQEVARLRGITLTGRSRPIREQDLLRFDYVIVMDAENLRDVAALAERVEQRAQVHLLREFDPEAGGELDVPDPYYGGRAGFERVHEMIERSCRGLLEHINFERTL
ncbi:MAG TPA: low molecular weight protein-tyrosine-phosphatase [Longimicrobiales bacterium]